MLRIGIDIGGTFTDFVVYDPDLNTTSTFKLLTDSKNPAQTVLQGLQEINTEQPPDIVHGSTVATNALLEHKGARTALVTTRGFKDVIEIARQNRPDLYDWSAKPAPPLVPPGLRFDVNERVDYRGQVQVPLELSELEQMIHHLDSEHIESIAICLLFSFLYPVHEQQIAERLRQMGYFVSTSSEILPEFREYERTSTTVVNAYVAPILNRYLSHLETHLPGSTMQIMQSNGGMIGLAEARNNGARCILSGPAGGIIGAQAIGRFILAEPGDAHALKLITFDMGGTSTDVSLIDGQPGLTTEASIGGYPIHLPLLDIHTIGAGGGSIAHVDAGGSLRVGPQSAGATPGPACYGKGDQPTVTDANLVLGRLLPDYFLGGKMHIYPERAFRALEKLSTQLNLTVDQAAYGVIEVVNAQMERALRVISVERGYDPSEYSLFSFGGAGGLHAVELARAVGIPKVIISKFASTLSAFGMLTADVVKDYVKTVMLPGSVERAILDRTFEPLILQGKNELKREGIYPAEIKIQASLDLRYRGQSYELSVPYSSSYLSAFHDIHQFTYGYAYIDKEVEIVNLRIRAIGKTTPISLPKVEPGNLSGPSTPLSYRDISLPQGRTPVPVYEYSALLPGTIMPGPALIVSSDTTILIGDKDVVNVDGYQNLLIDISSII